MIKPLTCREADLDPLNINEDAFELNDHRFYQDVPFLDNLLPLPVLVANDFPIPNKDAVPNPTDLNLTVDPALLDRPWSNDHHRAESVFRSHPGFKLLMRLLLAS